MVLFIPFFEPSYIGHNIPILHMIFRFGTYGAILFIGVLYISSLFRNKKKISTPVLFATVYSAIIFISTVLNNGEIVSCLVEGLSLIALFMLSDSICQKSVSRFLRIIYPIFYTFVVINFITMLIYPNGMYMYVMDGAYHWVSNFNWFLGLENAMIIYLLPTLVYTYIIYLQNNSKWNFFNCLLISAICIYIPIVRWKAATMVCFALFFIVVILSIWRLIPDLFNARTYVILNIFFFVGLVLTGMKGGIVEGIVTYVAETILHKSDTLNVRMNIWGVVLNLIKEHPILGYGYEATRIVTDKMKYNSPHNQYLWIIYRGGLVQFTVFAWFLWKTAKSLFVRKEYLGVKIVSIGLCVSLLMWQTEAITAYPIMIFLVFAFYFCDNREYLAMLDKFAIKKIRITSKSRNNRVALRRE